MTRGSQRESRVDCSTSASRGITYRGRRSGPRASARDWVNRALSASLGRRRPQALPYLPAAGLFLLILVTAPTPLLYVYRSLIPTTEDTALAILRKELVRLSPRRRGPARRWHGVSSRPP